MCGKNELMLEVINLVSFQVQLFYFPRRDNVKLKVFFSQENSCRKAQVHAKIKLYNKQKPILFLGPKSSLGPASPLEDWGRLEPNQ